MADDARYRLAPVRDVRARTEAHRRGDLANAVGDASATELALAAAHARTGVAERALADALVLLREPLSVPERRVIAERFVARRRRELAELIDAEARAAAAHDERLGVVDVARGRLARARAERELIERHFTRWREARAKLAERRADE
ncbi:MAG TPA: hypothetical protein VH143_27125 [Kofleriaceae bacterium]|jgi:hypothetical protein|nr:hypothetical protein [Kofleriaceae bacterium]